MDVGKRITVLRTAKGWTTNYLANRCGISQSFLRAVELGEKGISVENLELLCAALDISLRDFFTSEQEIEDPLFRQISCLTQKQREALSAFLKAMQ